MTLARIAPKIAVPKAAPIVRKKVIPEVATPSSEWGTAFWAASTSTCMRQPSPAPSTTMQPDITEGARLGVEERQQEEPDGR